jgi:hypothetical protein
MMTKFKINHLLMFAIGVFFLYHLVGKCSSNLIEGVESETNSGIADQGGPPCLEQNCPDGGQCLCSTSSAVGSTCLCPDPNCDDLFEGCDRKDLNNCNSCVETVINKMKPDNKKRCKDSLNKYKEGGWCGAPPCNSKGTMERPGQCNKWTSKSDCEKKLGDKWSVGSVHQNSRWWVTPPDDVHTNCVWNDGDGKCGEGPLESSACIYDYDECHNTQVKYGECRGLGLTKKECGESYEETPEGQTKNCVWFNNEGPSGRCDVEYGSCHTEQRKCFLNNKTADACKKNGCSWCIDLVGALEPACNSLDDAKELPSTSFNCSS